MIIEKSDSQRELKRDLIGFISLFGSTIISAISFIIIASNRIIDIEPAMAAFIILFLQWQTLGLTIAKAGIEQVVFAVVTENESAYFDPAKYVVGKALPLSAIFSTIILFVFSPWAAFVAFCTIILDTYSLIIMADLNARKRFRTTAISNLLNYPLFFAIFFLFNAFGLLTLEISLAIFVLTSITRLVWLRGRGIIPPDRQEVRCNVNVAMGLQQALNYLMFKADQIVLAVSGLTTHFSDHVLMYLFLAKFPELLSGVLVIAGTVLFPRYYIAYPFDFKAILSKLQKTFPMVLGYVSVLSLALYIYSNLWKGRSIPWCLLLPFLVQAVCILVANNITYSTLRQGYLRRLLANLAISILTGVPLFFVLCFNFNTLVLAWTVPLQLLVFITLTFFLKWGRPVELYDR